MRKRIVKRKMGLTICQNCKKQFEKPLSEIRRNEKLSRPNFCCRSCVGKNNVKNFGKRKKHISSFYSHDCSDEYTKFRYHFRTIQNRSKERQIEMNITIDDLKNIWEKQNGICEFTGVKLILSSYSKINKNPIYSASLDRIDSSKGYIKGNIRWVSRAINWMKNNMNDEMTWELCNLISENAKKRSCNLTTP